MLVKSILAITVLYALCVSVSAVDMSKLKPFNITIILIFHQDDPNQDGVLTVAELEAIFDKYDANHDGRESRQEYTQMICAADPELYQIAHYLFDDYDQNHDHHLEKIDYDLWHAKMDVNGDGLVTQDEFGNHWLPLFEYIELQADQHPHGNSHEHGHCPHAG